jgi:hypothetical protein
MIFGTYVAAVNYTKVVNGKVSPSGRVATLISGTGCRILWKMAVLRRIQAMIHRQFAAKCVHFSVISWWLNRNHFLKLRWCNIMKASDVCHCFIQMKLRSFTKISWYVLVSLILNVDVSMPLGIQVDISAPFVLKLLFQYL